MDKLIRDGMVAVLYSPGYGAGWYSWNNGKQWLLFHPEIVDAVFRGDLGEAAEIAEKIDPDVYTGGAYQLTIKWVPIGTVFKIDEYDGSESVSIVGGDDYVTA